MKVILKYTPNPFCKGSCEIHGANPSVGTSTFLLSRTLHQTVLDSKSCHSVFPKIAIKGQQENSERRREKTLYKLGSDP